MKNQPNVVRWRAAGGALLLSGLALLLALGCGPAGKPTFKDLAPIEGSLDLITDELIAGWAWERMNPTESIKVDIYDGNTLLTTVEASKHREDLSEYCAGHTNHGFHYAVPRYLRDGREHVIHAKTSGTGVELGGSPKKYTFNPPR